jgi:hypothetical protein
MGLAIASVNEAGSGGPSPGVWPRRHPDCGPRAEPVPRRVRRRSTRPTKFKLKGSLVGDALFDLFSDMA